MEIKQQETFSDHVYVSAEFDATGSTPWLDIPSYADTFALQVSANGTVTTFTAKVQGSLNTDHLQGSPTLTTLAQATQADGLDVAVLSAGFEPVKKVRVNVSALVFGTATRLYISMLATKSGAQSK